MKNEKFLLTIKVFLGLTLKTSKTITVGDMCKSTRTSRKKSLTLKSTAAKVNDRLHIKSHTWAVSNADVFVSM